MRFDWWATGVMRRRKCGLILLIKQWPATLQWDLRFGCFLFFFFASSFYFPTSETGNRRRKGMARDGLHHRGKWRGRFLFFLFCVSVCVCVCVCACVRFFLFCFRPLRDGAWKPQRVLIATGSQRRSGPATRNRSRRGQPGRVGEKRSQVDISPSDWFTSNGPAADNRKSS